MVNAINHGFKDFIIGSITLLSTTSTKWDCQKDPKGSLCLIHVVFGANASRRAAVFPCNCCVLLFEHFTCCRCWHVCCISSLMLNRGCGWGGLITFLTALRLLATRVHVTCCRCCQSWANSSKRRTAAEETQSRQQGRRNYESFEGRCWYVARFVFWMLTWSWWYQ